MKRLVGWIGIAALAATLLGTPGRVAAAAKDDNAKYGERLTEAKLVFQELMSASDRKVPQKLLDKAKCIVVIPDMVKGAVGFGARWGNGVISCRHGQDWTAPVFVALKGGSWGLQIGAEKTDLVLFMMNEKGARSLVNKSKFTLGGTASVAAGPFGRSGEAATDLNLNAEIYSYAKSKGLFAGISLEGASLRPSTKANQAYYGKPISPQSVLFANRAPSPLPAEAKDFLSVLPR